MLETIASKNKQTINYFTQQQTLVQVKYTNCNLF